MSTDAQTTIAPPLLEPMPSETNCIAFVGLSTYLRNHFGPDAVDQVVKGLVGNERYLIVDKRDPARTEPVQLHHLTDTAYWVSNDFFLKILANARQFLGSDRALIAAGEGAVAEQLSKSILFMARILGPGRMAKRAAQVNTRFTRNKTVHLSHLTRSSATFTLSYVPGMRVTKDLCHWNLGVYKGVAKLTGVLGVRAQETHCVLDRDEACVLKLTWNRVSLFKRIFSHILYGNLETLITDYDKTVGDRDQLIDHLTQSEKRYRDILDSIEEGYFEVDLAGNVTFVNRAIIETYGYSREALMGMNYRQYTSPETSQRMFDIFNQIYKTGRSAKIEDYEIITQTGAIKRVETSAYLIRDPEGNPVGFRGLTRDITEHKRVQEERAKLQDQFIQAQKFEAIGTLAGGIAHDFNNLLMGIQGRASLLQTEVESDAPQLEHLQAIETYVKSASQLTQQLLGFARGGKYEVKPINLNELIRNTAIMFGRTRKEINIRLKFQKAVWTIEADKGQIEQVLLNLFVNAWQAMPDGGDLTIEIANTPVNDDDASQLGINPGRFVRVLVTDTGIGISPETQPHIFEPFFSTKTRSRGTGLGLASAYGIIKNHHGAIFFESEVGKGTRFSIYLPASTRDVDQKAVVPQTVTGGTEKILLVDDEELILDVNRQMLEQLGYSVITANTGQAAISAYQKQATEINLVILDLIMPDMNGGAVFRRLKKNNPEINVLISSGYSIDDQAAALLKQGCKGFIQKPFSIEQLANKIREVIPQE
jgi:PAS domain S-box-containing protein